MIKLITLSILLSINFCAKKTQTVECITEKQYTFINLDKSKDTLAKISINSKIFYLSYIKTNGVLHFSATNFYAGTNEFTQGIKTDTVKFTYKIINDSTMLMSFKKNSFTTTYEKSYRIQSQCLKIIK